MLNEPYPKEASLKDGRRVTIRPLARGDFSKLCEFFQRLPEEDRLFLHDDVTDPRLIQKWTDRINFDEVIPIVAEDAGTIVADGTLHLGTQKWMRHVGQIRLVTARTHRHSGLGTIVARELVTIAEQNNLEKLYGNVIEDDVAATRVLAQLGFKKVAVLKDFAKDQHGRKRDVAIMINDVAEMSRLLEDWIQDSMIPAYRVPGGLEQ